MRFGPRLLWQIAVELGLAAAAAWNVFKWALDWYGRIGTAKDMTEIQTKAAETFGWLVTLPGWVPVLFFAAFFLLTAAMLFWPQPQPTIALAPLAGQEKSERTPPPAPQPYIHEGVVYAGTISPATLPWFSGRFARSGKRARIFVDYATLFVGMGSGGWSQRFRVPIADIADFTRDESIRQTLISSVTRPDGRVEWRWGELSDPRYSVAPDRSYRGRVTVIVDDGPEEHFYFIVVRRNDAQAMPIVIGRWEFDFVDAWETER